MTQFPDQDEPMDAAAQQAGGGEAVAAMVATLIEFLASAADEPMQFRTRLHDRACAKMVAIIAASHLEGREREAFASQAAIRLRLLAGLPDMQQN